MSRRGKQVTLQFEPLEPRFLPDASAFVSALYRNVLQRNGSPAEINAWVGRMSQGVTPAQVALGFTNSHESHQVQVISAFQEVLHRLPELPALQFFAGFMDQGGTSVDVRRELFASAEYQFAHPDNQTFVLGLYQDTLHRPPAAAELQSWVSNLTFGVSRDRAAQLFLDSNERLGQAVDTLYFLYLGRAESASERASWIAEAHRSGGAIERIAAGFAASREFQIHQGV